MKRKLLPLLVLAALLVSCKPQSDDDPITVIDSELPESLLYGHYTVDSISIGNQDHAETCSGNHELYINPGKRWVLNCFGNDPGSVLEGGTFTYIGDTVFVFGASVIDPVNFTFDLSETSESYVYDGIGISQATGSSRYYIRARK